MYESRAITRSDTRSAGAAFRERLDADPELRTAVASAMGRFAEFADALQAEIEGPEFQTQEASAREFIDGVLEPIRRVENIDDSLEELNWLARIAGIPEEQIGKITHDKIWRALLAWHANKEADGRAIAKALSAIQPQAAKADKHEFYEPQTSQVFRWPSFPGSKEWKNWGIGRDESGSWHLFHFIVYISGYLNPTWKHHRYVQVPVAGRQDDAARIFLEKGELSIGRATYEEWRHIVSRLGRAIKTSVASVGHKPQGLPQGRYRHGRWIPCIRFGTAVQDKQGRWQLNCPD